MVNLTLAHVILAGGRSRRLGRVRKPQLEFRGRTLLDHALVAGRGACHQVVVGPPELSVPPGVRRVREDPPFGGPVAGIGAGVAELDRVGCSAQWLLVTACDHPYAEAAARALFDCLQPGSALRAEQYASDPLGGSDEHYAPDPLGGSEAQRSSARTRDPVNLGGVDLITPTDSTGHRQTLFALYRRSALMSALDECDGGHDMSVRRLIAGLRSTSVRLPDDLLDDVDDPAAAQRFGIPIPQSPEPS